MLLRPFGPVDPSHSSRRCDGILGEAALKRAAMRGVLLEYVSVCCCPHLHSMCQDNDGCCWCVWSRLFFAPRLLLLRWSCVRRLLMDTCSAGA